MRRLLLYITFVLGFIELFSQNISAQNFSIRGKYIGNGVKAIAVSYRDTAEKWITKECEIVKGRFSLNGNVRGATDMWITSKLALGSRDDPNGVEVLIESGNIEIELRENHFKSIKINGSPIQQKSDELEKNKLPIYIRLQRLNLSRKLLNDSLDYFVKLKDSTKISQTEKKGQLILDQIATVKNELIQIEIKFIAKHPDDYLSAYLLEKQYFVYNLDGNRAKLFCNNFSATVQNSFWTRAILIDIDIKNSSAIGATAKDFATKDINGSVIRLSAFKGKQVVILDFWASWCVPCRESFPHLKLSYEKYKNTGLVIILASIDKDEVAWQKAIQADGIDNWHHVLAFDNNESAMAENLIEMKYQATPIPMCYLIDKQGIIVGKWLGQSSENEVAIDKKLQEIFGF